MPKLSPDPAHLQRTAEAMALMFDEGVPAVLRGVGTLFEVAEVFAWIKRAHPPARANTAHDKIVAVKRSWGLSPDDPHPPGCEPGRPAEIYRGGGLVLDASPFLPADTHDTFDHWVRDASDRLGGEFCMQAPGLECASWDALERLQTLLHPVLALTGPRTYRYNAFVGDYRRTPFGFHLDPHQEAVFQYVLQGRRRGLFWEGLTLTHDDAAWVEHTNGLTTPHREPEVVLELEPGDLVFWPGTHLHGFEAEGPSMGLSMVIDRISPRSRDDVVAGLHCATMGGKAALPMVADRTVLTEDDVIECRGPFSLAYERFDDALIVAVCGRTFDWPDPASIAEAIGLLDLLRERKSERLPLRTLVQTCANENLSSEDICEVMTMLANLGLVR